MLPKDFTKTALELEIACDSMFTDNDMLMRRGGLYSRLQRRSRQTPEGFLAQFSPPDPATIVDYFAGAQ